MIFLVKYRFNDKDGNLVGKKLILDANTGDELNREIHSAFNSIRICGGTDLSLDEITRLDTNGQCDKCVLKDLKKKEILTDEEREYLSNLCRSFMNKIIYISKTICALNEFNIHIVLTDSEIIILPNFRLEEKFKGMDGNTRYTPKELNLK